MKHYDFTTVLDRRNSDSIKWNESALKQVCGNPKAIPLWVADMDFAAPPEVIQALKNRVDHGVFGYAVGPRDVFKHFIHWTRSRFNWEADPGHICYTPGIISALATAVSLYSSPGDGVIIQPPVYRPFYSLIKAQDRRVLENPLLYDDGRFTMDFDHLETLMKESSLMLLCSPHNPSGRVWTEGELRELSRLAKKHSVLVVSDEIHADMTYTGHTHHPMGSILENSITCMAPSKTFNIAGEHFSCIIIPDENMRNRFSRRLSAFAMHEPGITARTASLAAYRHGEPWLKELIKLLEKHVTLMDQFFTHEVPEVKFIAPEASFIAFLDVSELEKRLLPGEDLVNLLGTKGGIALHRGSWFGTGGEGFVRINFGTPTSILTDALQRFKRVVSLI